MTRNSRLPEWLWLSLGAVTATALAFESVVPSLQVSRLAAAPILYSRDAISHAALMRAILEGNPVGSDRMGYPFTAEWLDYPVFDWGSIALIKALGLFSSNYALIFNLYFLLGFPLAFASAYLVSRRFELSPAFATVAAMAFALAAYHFERLSLHGHLFLTMYWVVPVYFLLGWQFMQPQPRTSVSRRILRLLGLAALTGFGIYYTAFGLIGLTAALFLALSQRSTWSAWRDYLATVVPLIAGVALQLAPTFLYHLEHGPNPLAFERSTMESELWALRPVQLILPHLTHRVPYLAERGEGFYYAAIPGNESVMSSTGLLASLGLLFLLQYLVFTVMGRAVELRLRMLAISALAYVSFATIGGLGFFVAMSGFTGIRAWNRLSIFILFAGVIAALIPFRETADRFSMRSRMALTPLVLPLLVGFIWVDQTPSPRSETLSASIQQRTIAGGFIEELEGKLPVGAAVYQLPFVGYPEGYYVRGSGSYEFMKPYIESSHLRFNLGGMKGREGDRFYRSLAQRSVETQIRVIRQLGFSGIYVDRMGLADYGTGLIARLEHELGASAATYRSDRRVVYFDLANTQPAVASGALSPTQAAVLTDFEPSFSKRRLSD